MEDNYEEEDQAGDEKKLVNTQESKPPSVTNYINNFDFAEKVRKLVKIGTSIPNNRKLSLKKMNSNSPNLSKNGPSKVKEFESGKLKKIAIFEDEGDAPVIINNTKDAKFAKSNGASKDSDTLANDLV